MEGDFYKYFDVYSADKEYLSTLSILAPDSMLVLRDQGYSFDYEIHDGILYVIHDYDILTVKDFQAFHSALQYCLDELVPQIAKQHFDGPDTQLSVSNRLMRFWALLYALRIAGFGFLIIVVNSLIGVAIAKIVI